MEALLIDSLLLLLLFECSRWFLFWNKLCFVFFVTQLESQCNVILDQICHPWRVATKSWKVMI